MGHTYFKCWYHIVWATHNREPLLKKNIREMIFSHIKMKAFEKGYFLDEINGMHDHVHCLFSINPKYAISKVVKDIKGESSHWINASNILDSFFKWQDGFSVFTVSENDVPRVRAYIQNQEAHHQDLNYKDEFES